MYEERRHDQRASEPSQRGDEEALYRRHHAELVRLVQGRLRVSREVADDACAFAWLQLVRKQPARDNVVGWLYTVAKYEVFAAYRDEMRETPTETLPVDRPASSPAEEFEIKEILAVVSRLRPQQRLVLLLQAQGYSYTEICERTGKTFTWVNRHISEGRREARRLAAE